MDNRIVAVYCQCDDLLKAMNHVEDPQRQMNDAEVMTTALVAAMFQSALASFGLPFLGLVQLAG